MLLDSFHFLHFLPFTVPDILENDVGEHNTPPLADHHCPGGGSLERVKAGEKAGGDEHERVATNPEGQRNHHHVPHARWHVVGPSAFGPPNGEHEEPDEFQSK